jgi:acyl-CoA reductase-like NAD-dependent aldehyde dehydrogenase/uncharacterized protein (DUF2141 family)
LDALSGDLLVTLEQARFYEAHANQLLKPRKIGKPAFLFSGARFIETYEPCGVVLIFSPSNYPFQLSVVPMISALVAGNAVLLKCSEKIPRVANIIRELCKDAGFPEDLVQVVDDPPDRAETFLDAAPDLVFFTGSSDNGRAVAQRAVRSLIPVALELGGKDAALVFADCNLDRTVEGVTYGAFSNAGQVCVGIKRLYVESEIFDIFVGKLVTRTRQLRIGTNTEADIGLLQGEAGKRRLVSQVEDAIAGGAILHLPQRSPVTGDEPIILSRVPRYSRLLTEETFGPVLCIDTFEDEAEAISCANNSPFSLSCSIWTGSQVRGRRVANQVNAGTCAVNDAIRNIANPFASFGGNRNSGHGRYHGPQGLFAFSRIKSVMITGDKTTRERHWFPYTQRSYSILSKILSLRHRSAGLLGWASRILFLALCFLLLPLAVGAQELKQGHLKIDVAIPRGSHGKVAYLIFTSQDGFPNNKSKSVRGGFVNMNGDAEHLTIDAGKLPAGRYAVSVYQDLNGNGKLDSGAFGIPNEPVGISNNPKIRYGPPRFDDSAFVLGESDQTISIVLAR